MVACEQYTQSGKKRIRFSGTEFGKHTGEFWETQEERYQKKQYKNHLGAVITD